ncbi:aromatic-ring-hydroxylating dioxygenase subunit beta [Pseudonocardia sp.]|uniref:aromatic-ring-hydroxylating dioxygenase subunit beta n=1 Tax=Pseudonocardia sp. TaxID=60912 RepID=UPI002604674E|nr:aromatic-ring-hydroxylating dioxygenase subunit beta [Pseudonocardia sp.]
MSAGLRAVANSTAAAETPAEFLVREAGLLDDNRLPDWLGLLAPDIDYRVPVRVARGTRADGAFSDRAFYYKEDAASLAARVERLGTDEAWCEHPPTGTRRMVSNVRVEDAVAGGLLVVRSNLAVFCYPDDSPTPVILTADRQDALRPGGDSWRLSTRTVHLDGLVLGLRSLSIFL